MFVSTSRSRRNPRLYFFNDKSLPKGSKSERLVTPILDCGVNPKGKLAYKNFFEMTPKKDFVADNAVRVNVTATPNLESLSTLLGLSDSKFIKIYFKKNRVTASCRKHGRTFGARGNTLQETLQDLVNRVTSYQPLKAN